MPNDCWTTIEMVGPCALDAFREHYDDAPLECCRLTSTQPVTFKLYSRWVPPKDQLLAISRQYGLWIRATYEIEYGCAESGMYIVHRGEILVDASYIDRTLNYTIPE